MRVVSVRAAVLPLLVLAAACRSAGDPSQPPVVPGGDAARGKAVIERYGCTACHHIPGIRGPTTNVGPDLAGVAERTFLAGVVANTPDAMVRWIQDPPAVDSLTAMPALGLTEQQARDAAAYLYKAK